MSPFDLERTVESFMLLDTGTIAAALLLALGLGVVVALVYRASVPGRVLSPDLQSSLILLSLVAAMVMMVIGNNIARAFSLVGALAIVRFRTRLRSPWDISFVFFALAVGIASGVMAWRVAIIGTAIITLAILALYALPLAGMRCDRLRTLRCDVAAFEGIEGRVEQVLDRHTSRRWLMEARSLRFGESLSFRYRVVLADPDASGAFLRELAAVEGVERVILDLAEEAGGGMAQA
jgi:hypothetical protein